MVVRAKTASSNLIAFVVNQNLMLFADKSGKALSDRTAYQAYCSDGMSDLLFPFSIHLMVDGRAYTGCCSTPATPPVAGAPAGDGR